MRGSRSDIENAAGRERLISCRKEKMMEKMTWMERQRMHYSLCIEHNRKASEAIDRIIREGFSDEAWEEYKRESKMAHRHYGTAKAMHTRRFGNFAE